MEFEKIENIEYGNSKGDKKDCGISMGSWSLVFGLGNSNANAMAGCNAILRNFQG